MKKEVLILLGLFFLLLVSCKEAGETGSPGIVTVTVSGIDYTAAKTINVNGDTSVSFPSSDFSLVP